MSIDNFNGYYEFLNNDFPTWVEYEGIQFPNVNTAFQAARTNNIQVRKKISEIEDYQQFKQIVSKIPNPQNWFTQRYKVMQKLVRDKFKRNKELSNKLVATQSKKLINCYKTQGQSQMYWGAYKNSDNSSDYKGTNNLGKILEIVRNDIKNLQDTEKWITFQNLQEDPQLFADVSILVSRDGKIIQKLQLNSGKNYFLFGSHPKGDFKLEHPSISKFHATIYFSQLEVILIDTNSTHGTFLTRKDKKDKIQPLTQKALSQGDIITFGMSSRTYTMTINFQKVQKALKSKQEEMRNNLSSLKEENKKIKIQGLSAEELKSSLGYKKVVGVYITKIPKDYSYNDIKQMFKKFGEIQKIRMLSQNMSYKEGQQVIICYKNIDKMNQIHKDIERTEDGRIQKFNIKAIDKFQMQKLLDNNKSQRQSQRNNRQRSRSRQKRKYQDNRQSNYKDDKHKKNYSKQADRSYRK